MVKYLGGATIVGSLIWLISEVIERFNGTITPLSMGLLSLGLLILAAGIWGLHFHQRAITGLPSWIGAIGISIGCLCLSIVDARGMHLATIPEVNDHSLPLFLAGLVAIVVGTFSFGWAVIRHGVFPKWTGYFVIVSTVMTFAVEIAKLSDIGISLANLVLNAALIVMGIQVWSTPQSISSTSKQKSSAA